MKKAKSLSRALLCLFKELMDIKNRTRCILLILFILIAGCDDFEKENVPESNQPALPLSAQSIPDTISIKTQPTAKPERYMVYINWPRFSETRRLRIRLDQTLSVIGPNQTTFSHEVDHNQTLTYSFDILEDTNKVEKTFSKQIQIPRDFVVREGQSEFNESQILNVNRIFLNDIPLRTNGFNIIIKANELIADKGVIETFAENTKANLNAKGRGGGELNLNITNASGTLKIYMRGEHGGDGSKGPTYATRAKDGTSAGSGNLECHCVGRNCVVDIVTPWTFKKMRPFARMCSCTAYGSNAETGSNGVKGNKGLPAQPGGNSGTLKVNIKNGNAVYLEAFKTVGSPGVPGEGGDGQSPGLGGSGKTNDEEKDCRGRAAGDGIIGGPGDRGDQTVAGNLETICIYIESEEKNDCY